MRPLHRGKRSTPFAGRLDLERIGIFGQSFGGATAGEVCKIDRRCKAGINMDGMQLEDSSGRTLTQPFMMLYSEDAAGESDGVCAQGQNLWYRLVVKGARHFNYTDLSLILPLSRYMGTLGSIDGYRMETILNNYLLSFFDRHLKGLDAPLLNGAAP